MGAATFAAVPWNSPWFLDKDGKPVAAPLDFALTVQMRDINGDGFPDIYVCNDFAMPDHVWLNDGTGHFRALPRLAMRKEKVSLRWGWTPDSGRGSLDFMTTRDDGASTERRLREVVTLRPKVPVPGRMETARTWRATRCSTTAATAPTWKWPTPAEWRPAIGRGSRCSWTWTWTATKTC